MATSGAAAAAGSGQTPSDATPAGEPDPLARLVQELRDAEAAARRPLLSRSLATLGSDAVVNALKAESERSWSVDPHASLRLAEAIIAAGETVGRPDHVSLGLMAKGDALRYLGRYPEAVALLDQAGQAFLEAGDEVGWARTRIGWVIAAQLLGRGEEALASVERARHILVRHHEWVRAGGLDLNTAVVCRRLGRFNQALKLYDRAQQTYESLGAGGALRAAWAKMNKAILLTFRGEFRTAQILLEEAREVFVRHGDTVTVLQIHQNVAWLYAGLGDYTRALRLLSDAFALAEREALEANAAEVALNMTECYLSLNRNAEAVDLAIETVARFERCGTPTEAAKARLNAALAHARLGDKDRALGLLAGAAQTFADAGLTAEVAVAALHRASLQLSEQHWSAAFQEARHAQALFAERGQVVRQAQAELVQARAALSLGDHDVAAQLARAALEATQERDVDWLAHESHHVLARTAEARGDLVAALDSYGAAIESIERVQSRLASELRTNFLDDKLAVYHDAIDLCLRRAVPAQAFEYLERSKSRALVDYLAGNPAVRLRARDAADQALVDELAQLRSEHNWFYSRLYGHGVLRGSDRGNVETAEAAALQAACRAREKRIRRILERLALHAQPLEGVASPPTGRSVAPPTLDPATVLLEYYLREDGGAIFALSGDGLRTVPLATGQRDVQALLQRWQLNLAATAKAIANGTPLAGLQRNAMGVLTALYRALVQPVEEYLAGHGRLVVVPYGPTHAVPWHALFDGRRHLLERLEVATCPSSSLLQLCSARRRPPSRTAGSALVMAFSGGGWLSHVVEEAKAVASLFPGECLLEGEATEAALASGAPTHAILHLAAHGEARLDNPTFAHLRLADGQLTTAEVFNLQLDGALVTLSACETGRSVVTGGDELIGLSRGFLYAGASTLVQSLWRVEDGSTARLMEAFYRRLRAGLPKGAALREAQLALLQEGLSPYFWAPFQLVGDAGALASGT
jgi:CHAT domain-containing protein